MLVVFNFGFRERRLVLQTPVNRTRAFVNPAALDKTREHARRLGLVMVRHREIRIVPFAEDAESFEVARLAFQRILRMLAADPPESLNAQLTLLLPLFLEGAFDVCFDWQTVAVVTGHVRRVETHHRARFDDKVFKNFVHCGAEMDIGIRVRRTVVQNELLAALTGAPDQTVKVELGPFLEARWFALR